MKINTYVLYDAKHFVGHSKCMVCKYNELRLLTHDIKYRRNGPE